MLTMMQAPKHARVALCCRRYTLELQAKSKPAQAAGLGSDWQVAHEVCTLFFVCP